MVASAGPWWTQGPPFPWCDRVSSTTLTNMCTNHQPADNSEQEKGRQAGDQELVHKFWLANIRDPCIIGLDLLTHWDACVEMSGAAITLGKETIALQFGQGKKNGPKDQRDGRQAAAAQQFRPPVALHCHSLPRPQPRSRASCPPQRHPRPYTIYGNTVTASNHGSTTS